VQEIKSMNEKDPKFAE